MKTKELVIIGGGPAGVSAAIEAAKRGVSVALIDENRNLGGKVFKVDDGGLPIRHTDKIEAEIESRLSDEFNRVTDKIDLYLNTEVWAVHDDMVVELHTPDDSDQKVRQIKASTMVIATGAMERAIPFPGWTLPGVFTVGGLNSFIKRGVLPGHKILVAGSGPLLLVLAYNLIKAGLQISAIVEATRWSTIASQGWQIFANAGLSKLSSGFNYLLAIKKHRIPFYRSYAVVEAQGNGEITGARVAKIDANWQPISGAEKFISADVMAVGYGLIPALELTRLCGCEHHFDLQAGHWRVSHNENLETTVPGIFTAGDGLRVKGYTAAIDEGRLAAISACCRLGYMKPDEADRINIPLRKKMWRAERFGRTIDVLSAPRSGLFDIVTGDTVVCRCEDVTMVQIRKAVDDGARDVNDIKRRTRCGMGHCQGRLCGQVINELIWKLTGTNHDLGVFTTRMPVKPVPFEILASSGS